MDIVNNILQWYAFKIRNKNSESLREIFPVNDLAVCLHLRVPIAHSLQSTGLDFPSTGCK